MRLADDFGSDPVKGADDYASMNVDNTSGFNCRYVDGRKRRFGRVDPLTMASAACARVFGCTPACTAGPARPAKLTTPPAPHSTSPADDLSIGPSGTC
ncbi:hypothetical protein ACIHFC_35255 [Streptomyces sp. NPDC052013]|uniref:hypothetical protein n=1 Tax=Streptomyces sp. NPDC052013 TaxID=3365679 RepID=UPI0037D3D4E0